MSNFSILVIDDEPDNFDTIEALLISNDYDLHYASCGRDAVNALERFDPDLILLDAMMPEMDGFEVCQRIKATPQWQAVPIIMVTALTGKEDLLRGLSAGADDFITKPVNSIELRARVQSMLRIKKQHDRIQSLSKLQRNNIHSLENNLNELRLELTTGFPDELNLTLKIITNTVDRIRQHRQAVTPPEIDTALDSIDRAAIELDKLHQSFLFYLQLSLPTKEVKTTRTCYPQQAIEQTALHQAQDLNPIPKLVFDLENSQVAVTPEHMQYLINELLDPILTGANSQSIYIYGREIDRAFHFWIENFATDSAVSNDARLSELISLDSRFNRLPELNMRLKIVKKIVEIYDGLFLKVNVEEKSTVYVVLPLAT